MFSRRAFHRRMTAAALSCTPVFGTQAGAEPTGRKLPAGRYVDVHTHLGQTWNTKEPLTAEVLLRWMDAHEVAQAVVLPLISPEASSYPLTSDFVLAETSRYRDRLVPFCSIDPRTSFEGGHKALVEMLARYVEAGAKGFGEHKPGVKIDSPGNLALFAACAEVKQPILFHLDNQRNLDAPGLPGLAKVLEAVPGTNFIAHGPGWWASISGNTTQADLAGYPRSEVVPGGAVDALFDRFPNLYGDLSAGSGANAIARDEKFGREFLIRRADRLMFGTDFLAPGQDVPQFELFDKLDLPAEVQATIFRDNARRVLGLEA
jgi:predicted TIM-barrel fold metal-dependent hydrolase